MVITYTSTTDQLSLIQVRAFSSVLLRRIAFKSIATAEDPDAQLWGLVQENTRQAVKAALLVSLSKETNESTRHKLCDTISEIAKTDLLKGGEISGAVVYLGYQVYVDIYRETQLQRNGHNSWLPFSNAVALHPLSSERLLFVFSPPCLI